MSKDKEGSTYNYKKARGSGPNNPNWKGGRRIDPTGYIRIRMPDGKERYEHQIVWEREHKACLLKGSIVHHKDGNKLNNDPSNLEAMVRKQHTSKAVHGDNHLGFKHSEESKQKMREHVKPQSLLNLRLRHSQQKEPYGT